ncbi:MAG TPA: SsrA-binding protein SmpB [Cytophagales bacterium]|nr:SsrA-binding protein SmpB [Cytophagales bacterium]
MSKEKFTNKVSIKNKRASFEYQFLDTYVAGIQLTGTEIKSIREGKVNLQDGYCIYHEGELWLKQVHISHYNEGTYNNHDPIRDRKLLLNRKELNKLEGKLKDKGLTIVPTKLFTNERGYAKLEIALAKGKKLYDKRESIKEKDTTRELNRIKF